MTSSKERRLQAWALFARIWVSENARCKAIEEHLPMLHEGDLPDVLFYATDGDPVLLAQQIAALMEDL